MVDIDSNVGLVLRCDTATTQGASLAELDPISATSVLLIRLLPVCKCKYHLNTHGKSVTKVMEKSWNVMEFGFENCVGTLRRFKDVLTHCARNNMQLQLKSFLTCSVLLDLCNFKEKLWLRFGILPFKYW